MRFFLHTFYPLWSHLPYRISIVTSCIFNRNCFYQFQAIGSVNIISGFAGFRKQSYQCESIIGMFIRRKKSVLYICIYKLFFDQPVSTVHLEQHQSTEIVIIRGNSSITFIPSKNSAATNVRKAGHGKYFWCCSITALRRGAPEFLGEQSSSRAGNSGLGLAVLQPTVTQKKK